MIFCSFDGQLIAYSIPIGSVSHDADLLLVTENTVSADCIRDNLTPESKGQSETPFSLTRGASDRTRMAFTLS